MYKILAAIFIIGWFFSCNQNTSQDHEHVEKTEIQDETPEVLNDEKSARTLTSYKRSGDDIIHKLFTEAVNKDQRLEALTLRIESIEELKNDSLEKYQDYIVNSEAYWRDLAHYSNQIGDSLLKKEMKELIKGMESKYEKRISNHKTISDLIQKRKSDLYDQEILMKILVTEPMMNNYMRNELPDIKKIESILAAYDSLIKDMKPYTSIPK